MREKEKMELLGANIILMISQDYLPHPLLKVMILMMQIIENFLK